MVLKLYSFKPYLIGMKFKNFYPRYDSKTPENVKKILDEFAMSVKRPTETYDPDTNVISAKRNYSQLKEHMTMVSKHNLENPSIKFFVETNTGWQMVGGKVHGNS